MKTMMTPLAAPPVPRLRTQGGGRLIRELIDTMLTVSIVFALVNLACGRFVVDGISMAPTFETGQFILVSRVNYLVSTPQRGDVIVFNYPNDPTDDYIKRVIGTPGDTVALRDQQVYVNGALLNEPYINEPCLPRACPDETWTVGPDEVFVMGDNRNHSTDSREFGVVNRQFWIGEAIIRYFPVQDIGVVARLWPAAD